jgi:competence protein ComEC
VVEEPNGVSIIDGGQGDTLPRFLLDRGIYQIDTIIVTHADADHFGGISLLLSTAEFQVGQVFVNPDRRKTNLWEDFVSVMKSAKQRGTRFNLELTNFNPGHLSLDGVRLEVLAPSQEFAIKTTDGLASSGTRLSANTMSAVVRVWAGDTPRLLIAGDIDQIGLDNLLENNTDITADVLLFPHHGSLPGQSSPRDFVESLLGAVSAQLVVFSIGRGRYGTPHPEIVSAVLRSTKDIHIACTQLSDHCAAELPESASDLHDVSSKGAANAACCAGTIEVSLEPDESYVPARGAHLEFIRQNAPTALCRR